jgi:3-hydroxyisobutyrate dehydrogenase-like beta-hydroxyacid dehydrogenase
MVVYNRDRAKAVEFAALGAKVAQHPEELARDGCGAVFQATAPPWRLSTWEQATSAQRGFGTRIIELSTIGPRTSRKLHLEALQLDLSALDVAVSGSTSAAEAAPLRYSVVASADLQSAEPIFASVAKQWFYMGPWLWRAMKVERSLA